MIYSIITIFLFFISGILIISLIFNPFFGSLLLAGALYITYEWIMIDNKILAFVQSKNVVSVQEVLDDLGYSQDDFENCSFITCAAYHDIIKLHEQQKIRVNDLTTLGLNTRISVVN